VNDPVERPRRSDADLCATADAHLFYEVEMLCGALAELNVLERAKHDREVSLIMKNALRESWAVHSRALSDFLFSDSRKQADDVLAQDFFNDTEWEDIRPTLSSEVQEVGRRVGKEIAHLTYTRNEVKPEDRGWRVGATTEELTTALRVFLGRVPEKRVPSDFSDRCEAWIVRVVAQ
jgi:hypothetical protein